MLFQIYFFNLYVINFWINVRKTNQEKKEIFVTIRGEVYAKIMPRSRDLLSLRVGSPEVENTREKRLVVSL
jgi:hypothetical protein